MTAIIISSGTNRCDSSPPLLWEVGGAHSGLWRL